MGLFSLIEDAFDWFDRNIGQPVNETIQKYENYIPTVAGWATGNPWLGSVWNFANMDDADQRSGLGTLAAKTVAANYAKDFMDVNNSFAGTEGYTDFGGVPIDPSQWFNSYSDLVGDDGLLSSIFGTPTPTRISDIDAYKQAIDTDFPTSSPGLSALDPGVETGIDLTSGGMVAGGGGGGDSLENVTSRSFDPGVSTTTSYTPDEATTAMASGTYLDMEQPVQPSLEGISSVPQDQYGQTVIGTNSAGMSAAPEIGPTSTGGNMLEGIAGDVYDYVSKNKLKTLKDIYGVYSGYKSDQRAEDFYNQLKGMRDEAMSRADPYASDRALASNKWQAMVNDPYAKFNDYMTGVGPELQAAAGQYARAGRRNMLPTLMTQARQKYMSDYVPNYMKSINPAQFPGSNASSVSAQFAPALAAAQSRIGGGVPSALMSAAQGYDFNNIKTTLEDIFRKAKA